MKPAGLHQEVLFPGDFWQCLETFLIATTGVETANISWGEARDAAKHATMCKTPPHDKEFSGPSVNSTKGEELRRKQQVFETEPGISQ